MMNGMFYNCSTLTTIYCPYTWQCNESEDMFAGCTKLKGAVAYDDSKTDVTMANPKNGYFTIKLEAYVQMSPDQKTLTFFYDKLRHTRQGQTWGIDDLNGDDYPAWAFFIEDESSDANMVTTKTVFDGSFKDFSPTTTFGWFSGYKALTTLEGLKNLNTSEVTNMSEIFKSCQALEKLDLKNFNTENVTDMSQMFYGCSGLKEINLSSFNTQKVETMYGMFAICSALKDINLSSFNTENVKNMSWMFAYSSALTNLDLSSFNTQNVTDMEGMFSRCSGLTSLNLKNFNTSNVTKMKQMFDHCSALQPLNLSSFNTENVTLMNWMFWECSSLKELDLSSFNTGKVEYIFSMFENCAALTTIYCPNTWQGKYSQDMFLGCTALKGAVKYDASKLDVTMANPKNGYFTIKLEAYVHMSPDQKTLTFFYDKLRHTRQGKTWGIEEKNEDGIPAWTHLIEEEDSEWNTTTTKAVFDASFKDFRPTTTDYWFSGFKVLQTIEGLEILNTSEVTDMSYMFSNCPALKNIDLKSFNTEKVETMYGMFYRCSVLTTLDLSSFNTEKVKDMRDMFMNCSSLNTLNLSSFNTQKVMHMNGMFEDCATLTNLDLSSFNTQNVTDMWSMFAGCAALTTLDLSNFKTSNVTEMSKMFAGCSALQTLDLSNFKTEKVQYMTEMFSGCSVLTAIYCANTWQSKESKDMFAGCTKLQGAVKFDASKLDVTMANPTNGYFTKEKPTAIEQMFLNAHKAKGIYTLQGKRVSGNVEHLPAGVYIVNGKKVVVK